FCCDQNLDGNLTDRVDPLITNPGFEPRNTFRAPGIQTVDLAVNKFFKFTERQKLEVRSEFFNLFNHPNFGIPVHQLFFAGFTTEPANKDNHLFIDTRVPACKIQFALKFSFCCWLVIVSTLIFCIACLNLSVINTENCVNKKKFNTKGAHTQKKLMIILNIPNPPLPGL